MYSDTKALRFVSKDLGAVLITGAGGEDGDVMTGKKTLDDIRFVTGDWIDVAVYPEGYGGLGVGGAGGAPGARGFGAGRVGPGRENGMGGYRMRGLASERSGRGGGFGGGLGGSVPSGEWRRGERVEEVSSGGRRDAPGGGGGYSRRGRGRW